MSRNYYSEINLHFVWHTKTNLPLLVPAVEQVVHRLLKQRILCTPEVYLHQIGGTENHVHVAVSIPPTLTISEWIGQIKGGTSHDANLELGRRQKVVEWQSGYGVVSFGTADLPWVKAYIANQRQHHARDTAHDRLERITQYDDGP